MRSWEAHHLVMKQILLPLRHRRSPIAMQITKVASLQQREGTASSRAVIPSAGVLSARLQAVPSRRCNNTSEFLAIPELLACVLLLLCASFAQTANSTANSA